MSSLLIQNIRTLVLAEAQPVGFPLAGEAMRQLPCIHHAWLLVENGRIARFGQMPAGRPEGQVLENNSIPLRADIIEDATDRIVFPSFVDSHTHLVFAHSREEEWVKRIAGVSYEEIARQGGGILNSARRLREIPEEVLYEKALERISELMYWGTGAIEIKSGYGLNTESELKMLRVIRRLKETCPIGIKATFLGAHALPSEYRNDRRGYIDLLLHEMLPCVTNEGLADYIDVFCEKIAFDVAEMEEILSAAIRYGLRGKVHVNQFHAMGGIAVAVRQGAVSVDHLEVLNEDDLTALRNGSTIATLLPSAAFFLNDSPPPARKLIEAGVPVALASDFNPGTSPSGRMSFVLSLACIQCRMLPEEAIAAATLNGAFALEWADKYGSISPGKIANFFITKPIPSVAYLPYAFGADLIERVFVNGKKL